MNILITGAGSVMGQSIYKALALHDFGESLNIHFANSEALAAGRYFSSPSAPVVSAPILPLAADPGYLTSLADYVQSNDIDIVFPGTQHELDKVASFRDVSLKAATLPSKIVGICLDKVLTASTLASHGVRIPKTCSLRHYVEGVEKFDGSVIIKPNHSSASRSIFRPEDRRAAFQLVRREKLNLDRFVVQERLTGDEYTCAGYLDRYSKKLASMVFKRTLTADGATFYGEVVVDGKIQDYIEAIGEALIAEGLDFGHFNVQLIVTKVGPVVFEINGRLSSTEAPKAHYGFNSCAAFVYNIVRNVSYDGWHHVTEGRFLRYYEEVYF
jgi:carbamoyl-phosphate synthase large subunit